MMNTPDFENKMNELTLTLNAIERESYFNQFPDSVIQPDTVRWKDRGKKFAAIDVGNSGAWLVEKLTGEIFNIKGYGVPDYNKKKKADIGNIYTVDPKEMHAKRWNYLR